MGLAETPHQARESPLERATLARSERRWFVAILLVAAAVRVFWALYADRGPPIDALRSGDQYSYWYHGRELAHGNGYVSFLDGEPTAYYPVGYPALLAALFWTFEHTPIPDNVPLAANLIQAAVGTASVALVFVIGRAIFDTRVGLVGAGITALWPNLVFYVGALMIETSFTFLCLVAVAIIATHNWSTGPPGRARLVAFGVTLGIMALVRPLILFFFVGLVVAVAIAGSWRRAATSLAWVLLPLVVIVTPWMIRNAVVMDSFAISTNFGDTLCIDRSDDATGRFRFAAHEGCVSIDEPEVERYRGNIRKAVDWVIDHPDREVKQVVRRAWYTSRYDHDGLQEVENKTDGAFLGHRVRTGLSHTADWYYFVVLAVAAFGLPAFFRGRRPERIFVAIAGLGLLTTPLVLYGNPRYHIPALPFFALAAAVTLTHVTRRRGARRRLRAGA